MDLSDMRAEYTRGPLRREDLKPDPIEQFTLWFQEACRAGIVEPNAASLATAGADAAPSLRGTMLAWQRWDGQDWEIYWIDLASGTEQRFANNFIDDFDPVIEGDWLAWRQEDPAGEFGEVYVKMYNIATATHLLVTPHSDPAENLRLEGELLAFVSTPNFPDQQVRQIMLYNAATRNLRAVTTDLDHHLEMEMSGDRIAYTLDRATGPDTFAEYYDIETRTSMSLLYFPPARARWPDLSNTWMFWQDWDGHDWEIVGFHFATHTFALLTTPSTTTTPG